jgi:hypothetical protein
MKIFKKYLILTVILFTTTASFGQDEMKDKEVNEPVQEQSNIQQYTPSKLIGKGQWDVKWFNNLYTQTRVANASGDVAKDQARASFLTTTFEAYTGVGNSKRINLGLIARLRSNVISSQNDERGALDVFSFKEETGFSRVGLTAIAPSIKFVPFASASNFSIQSSIFIPIVDGETVNGVFLEQDGYVWQNRFFYDHTFPGEKWQLFSELTTDLNLGEQRSFNANGDTVSGSFANNSLNINPGVFLSYFPSSSFTVLALVQHSSRVDLGNDFTQNFTAVGGGAKYQLSKALNLELLYTNFVRGNSTGLGQTFNLGLRGIF